MNRKWIEFKPRWARSGTALGLVLVAFIATASMSWAVQDAERDFSKEPGYVDFAALGFDVEDAVVEVFLHDGILRMVAGLVRAEEPELATMLEGLDLVRVQRYELEERRAKDVEKKLAKLSKKLEKQNWLRVIRVREDGENIYVYFKFDGDVLNGVTVMAVDDEGFATFVNIVGEIDPEQIGRLGRKFDIDLFENDFDWDGIQKETKKKHRHRDSD